jgi:hypothetical protein
MSQKHSHTQMHQSFPWALTSDTVVETSISNKLHMASTSFSRKIGDVP